MSTQGTPQAFGKTNRLLIASEFKRVFDQPAIRVSEPTLLILAKPNDRTHARIGLVIGKKHVKTAVERNRLKRCIRESFRNRIATLPAIDVIVLARKNADKLDNNEIFLKLNLLWKRVEKKHSKNVSKNTLVSL